MIVKEKLQRGFSLVSAIFLLVVIAALGAFAVTLSTTQHQGAALDVLGARAYHAARSGIEWGAYQVIRNPGGIVCAAGGANNAVAMPAGTTMAGFAVNVNCTSFAAVNEGTSQVNTFLLVSTATQGTVGTADYVERQISVSIAP
jgi:MSHA biogenesis protein MshP